MGEYYSSTIASKNRASYQRDDAKRRSRPYSVNGAYPRRPGARSNNQDYTYSGGNSDGGSSSNGYQISLDRNQKGLSQVERQIAEYLRRDKDFSAMIKERLME